MAGVEVPEARRVAYSIVLGQAAITAVVALACYLIFGLVSGWSAALGGGISTVASLAMVLFAFRRRAGLDARAIAGGFYVGEAVKLALTVLLFVWTFKTLKPSFAAMFGGYIATLLVYWVALANALPPLAGRPQR